MAAKHGNEAREAAALVFEAYRAGRREGSVLPNNHFLERFDASHKSGLQAYAVAALAINIARSARIVTCSQSSFLDIVHYFPECRDRLRVVYNPLPRHFASVDMVAAAPSERRDVVLHVGKWEKRKNVAALVEAFAQLAPHYPALRLHLVGTDVAPNERAAVCTAIEAHAIQDRVMILTNLSDEELIEQYRSAAVFVMPSLHEGFSIPILEALHCGTPVVAAPRGAIPELFDNCFEPFDPTSEGSLAAAIRTLLTNVTKRHTLMLNGARRVNVLRRVDFREAVGRLIAE